MKTRAVLFDLGGTLVEVRNGPKTFRRVLRSMGIARRESVIEQAISDAEKRLQAERFMEKFGKIPCAEFWMRYDSSVLDRLGIADEKGDIVREVAEKWFDFADIRLYPDSEATLRKLREMGIVTGIISNAYEEEIHQILSRARLSMKMFDIAVGADTVHRRKPHRDIFVYALRRLRVRPKEAVFVGDQVDEDYSGAEDVGIRSLLIMRERPRKEVKGRRAISSLSEILDRI